MPSPIQTAAHLLAEYAQIDSDRRTLRDRRIAIGASLGAALAAARRQAGVTQQVLAAAIGVRHPTISRVESGQRGPSPELARAWIDALATVIDASDDE